MPNRKTSLGPLTKIAGSLFLAAQLAGCALLSPLPKPATVEERLAAFPTTDLPVREPVKIYWNAHKVPFVEAQSDHDAAVALGLVHAHLRLGQMELLRRVAQGRLAELAGPRAVDIDHSLRILGLARAAPDMLAAMPSETRDWLEAFAAGINHYVNTATTLPHEFTVLGLDREPWAPEDLLAIGRLASADVNWLVWFRTLRLRDRDDWPALWARMVEQGTASVPSIGSDAIEDGDMLSQVISAFNRNGSNSFAVSAARSASGGAMIASDPHLGLSLPNLWVLAGFKSPSYHALGMMIPGLPFIALGRNPWIAWGGTNMHAASSDLFDVSSLPESEITVRRETIKTRWWFDQEIEIRETPYGPILSDAPLLDTGGDAVLALRWVGHAASDEVTAMLNANKARHWQDFRQALDGFWVPGQNMVYADTAGDVGQVMAVKLPHRLTERPADAVLPVDAGEAWSRFSTAGTLPASYRPPSGIQVSANNRPADGDIPAGYFFSPDDRFARITELLNEKPVVSVDDLKAIQSDVSKPSAGAFAKAIGRRLQALAAPDDVASGRDLLVAALMRWDGVYSTESQEAVLFELLLAAYVRAYYEKDIVGAYGSAWRQRDLIQRDFNEGVARDDPAIDKALLAGLETAATKLDDFANWGDMHQIRLAHPLNFIPWIGGRYRFGDHPTAGSIATVMTTGHSITDEKHTVSFGSNARHISDLSDPDRNYFVLVGGQDGWLNSAAFIDQFAMFQNGDYIQIPLRLETVRNQFKTHMTLQPGKKAPDG